MEEEANAKSTEAFDMVRRSDEDLSKRHALRMYYGSILELALYVMVWGIAASPYIIDERISFALKISMLTSPQMLLLTGLVVLATFSFILNGATPLVNALVNKQLRFPLPFLTPSPADISVDVPSVPPLRPNSIEANFALYITRSQDAARVAQRRPNALLFVGTIVAVSGLLFFVLTLPGSRLGILIPENTNVTAQDFWSAGLQLLPRLLMLIFIQVLAGFFLRQYRSSMEDFRYYESVLRHREAQYLSYTLRKHLNDKKALLKFSDDILKDQQFGLLARGQTTASLEAQRAEANEFGSLYERFANLFARQEKQQRQKAPTNKIGSRKSKERSPTSES